MKKRSTSEIFNTPKMRKIVDKPIGGLLIIIFVCFSLASFSQTTVPVSEPTGGFEIDGDYSPGTNSGTLGGDWVDTGTYPNSNGNGVFFSTGDTVLGYTYIKRNYDEVASDLDYIYNIGGGSKLFDNPTGFGWQQKTANQKADIAHSMFFLTKNNTTNDQWLFVAADKGPGSGSNYIIFEFKQETLDTTSTGGFETIAPNGGRSENDLAISLKFTNGGTGSAEIKFYLWKNPGSGWTYEEQTVGDLSGIADARASAAGALNPFADGTGTFEANQAVEAGINVTELFYSFEPCFTSIEVKSIMISTTVSTVNASPNDFIFPILQSNVVLGTSIYYADTVCAGTDQSIIVQTSGRDVTNYSITPSDPNVTVDSSTGELAIDSDYSPLIPATFTISGNYTPGKTGDSCSEQQVNTDIVIMPETQTPVFTEGATSICPNGDDEQYTATVAYSDSLIYSISPTTAGEIDPYTGVVNWDNTYEGNVTITATAYGHCGTESADLNVTVGDSEDPTVAVADAAVTANTSDDGGNDCTVDVAISDATYSDNCSVVFLTWEMTGVTTGSSPATGINQVGTQTFNIGITTITYTVTDGSGNTATDEMTVTVTDEEAPVISGCPSDISQSNDAGDCSAVVTWTEPTASDNCTASGSLVWSKSHTPGSTFPVGTTIVTYTATDAADNTSLTCSFDVTVTDEEAPVISGCPSDISQSNDAGDCSAVVTWAEPTASDNCTASGSLVWSKSHTPGSTFPVGTTIVTYTATDAADNTSLTCSFDVTVTDEEAPVISGCPSDISQSNDAGDCSAVVTWTEPTASDNCTASGSLVWSKSHTPGSTFPVGTTIVTYTATDAADNTSLTCSFDVTVTDEEAPVISGCPSDISQSNDAGDCSAVVTWTEPTASDNCTASGSLVWSKSHTPGSTFPVGTTIVTYTATDAADNTSLTCSFDVTVTDEEAPVISGCPSDISQSNDAGDCSAVVTWTEPTASDNCTASGSLVWSKSHTPGSTFPVGTTIVTYTATDTADNTSLTCSFDVTVTDEEAPVISGCPSDISQSNDAGDCSAVVTWTEPTASDNCTASGSLVWSKSHTPGSTFPVGTTIVTYTATDAADNTSLTCSFDVTVTDEEAPVISGCPSDISQSNDAGDCSAVVTWTEPTASDNCTASGSLVWSKSHTPGSTFPVGTTIVTYTATDAADNTSLTCSFDVTVTDEEAPVISGCPSDISQSNDAGDCSAVVTWTEPTASDNCTASGSLAWSKSHTPGSTFPVGTTIVTYTATDAADNTSLTCSFDVTVTDEEAPVISGCPSDISQSNDAGDCSAVVTWTEPTASDNCTASGSLVWSKSHTPGSTFPVGTTIVTYTATDAADNTSLTCSFDVTVTDEEAPVISGCPSDISQSNDAGDCSAVVTWTEPTASDNCTASGSLVWSKSHTPGSTFPVGTTIVTYTATDAADNTSLTCSFDVTVTDEEAPVISGCPSDISQSNDAGDCSAVVTWTEPTASDNCTASGSLVWSKSHTPGSTFPVGTTIVTYTATDAADNTSLTCSFDVTVTDEEAPVISGCPSDISQSNDAGDCSAVVTWTEPTASDNCTASGSLVWSKSHTPGSTFPVGTTIVTYTATDAADNTSLTCSFDVTVTDEEAPVISGCPSDISQSNDAGDCSAVVTWTEPTASDNCTASGSLVWSKSHTPGSTFPVGTTIVTYTATDAADNTSLTCSFDVTVTDEEAPVISGCPSDISQSNDAGDCSAVVTWTEPTASDNCTASGSLVWSKSHTPGSTFPVGTTIVTYTATDAADNTSLTCSFDVTVTDEEAPVISGCPSDISQSNDAGDCSAVVTWTEPTASDNCTASGSLVWSKSHTPGSTFPVGTTIVTYTATDTADNTSLTCSFDVTVTDEEAPVISGCPSDISQSNDAGDCSAVVTWTEPTASDNCTASGSLVWSKSHTPGSTFPVGTTIVTYTATDAADNTSLTCSFDVTVTDEEAPVISGCPSDISQSNDAGDCSAVVTWTEPTASDNCTASGSLVWSKSHTPGSTFPVGTTIVTYTATDAADNTSLTCSFDVTVTDEEAPVISTCAPDQSAFADGSCEALVPDFTGDVTASDNCTLVGDLVITQSPAVGTTVTTGVTVVTITVTDEAGNDTSCDVNFTVNDVTPPTFTCNDITIELDESDQYSITEEDIALIVTDLEDNCSSIDGEISISLDTEVFTCATLGAQTVKVTVSDAEGNTETCDVTITVIDIIPPSITCAGDVTATIQSNGSCTGFVSVPSPTVSDNCGVASVTNDFNSSSNASGNYPAGETVLTWTVTDNSGNAETCTQTINVISEPQAINDSRSTPEDTPITIPVLANDLDCDANIVNSTLQITSDPTNGNVVVNSNGTVTYTPNTNYNGSDQFTYEICDADGQCDEAIVTINVTPVNDPPVAVDDINNTFINTETTGKVLTNDYDIDGNSLSTTLQSGPSNGILVFNTDGTYSYTPNTDYLGEDIFTYQLSDGQGGTDLASVYITVISDHSTQNQPPVANEDAYVTKENVIVTGNMLENDYDPDGNPLVFNTELVVQPPVGTIQVFADGSFEYTPETDYSGQVNFTYQVCDDLTPAMCNTADVIIIIDPNANDNITIAVDDGFFTKVNSKLIRDVSANDNDPEGDNTTYSLKDASLHGTVSLGADGFFTYTPNTDYIGPDHFTYQVCDDGDPSACDHATVYINVSEVNHPPIAVDDWFNREDETANVLANDSDPDGDELVLNTTPIVDVTNGSLVINSDGTYTYTPDEFYFGLDSFTYQVCDNALVPLCDQATVVIYLDTDKDGAADVVDIDDDNDGILDVDEGDQTVDTDNDGIPDSLDIDSDNDGITDNEESQDENDYVAPLGIDSDGDGWDDAYDDDSGGTPIVIVDSDGDGSADFVDTDSDNDGIDDAIEGHDANHDGVADVVPTGTDSDGDGLDDAYDTVVIGDDPVANVTGSNAPTDNSDGDKVSDYRDTDSDNDGLTDAEEVAQSNDPDNDGLANYLDIDSDGDGITDNQESQPDGAYVPPTGQDTDGDGIDDAYDPDNGGTPIASIDTDGDGDPDYLDEDSDNDSVPDSVEAHDANGDGVADTTPSGQDSDGDGLDDAYDTTNDFSNPLNVIGANTPSPNSDDDGLSNWRDIDDDNDGILTSDEVNHSSDNDGDGVIDYLDIDSDNDGIVDNMEGQDKMINYVAPSGNDSDNDGLDDTYDPDIGGTPIGFTDTDNDGILDYLDEDSDNDNVPDYIEGQDINADGKPDVAFSGVDSDGDGLDDAYDTIDGTSSAGNSTGANVTLQNTDQNPSNYDHDSDDIPDWRDTDDDGDNILTILEVGVAGDDPTQYDCNWNEIPNYLDVESCDLLIPDGFSPNGDGINDYFRVRGIYQYPNASIEIYNRWGSKVFEKENFGNIPIYGDPDAWWDGRANVGGSSNSDVLPSGTYFVILILDGSTIHKGIVYINR